jgi:hypothetical protein
MPGNNMPAQAIAHTQCPFQVEATTGRLSPQSGAAQGFHRNIRGKYVPLGPHHRETGPIHGDAFSQSKVCQRIIGLDYQLCVWSVPIHAYQCASTLNKPGKHGAVLVSQINCWHHQYVQQKTI